LVVNDEHASRDAGRSLHMKERTDRRPIGASRRTACSTNQRLSNFVAMAIVTTHYRPKRKRHKEAGADRADRHAGAGEEGDGADALWRELVRRATQERD
jgi:hypothetical protein